MITCIMAPRIKLVISPRLISINNNSNIMTPSRCRASPEAASGLKSSSAVSSESYDASASDPAALRFYAPLCS